MMMITVEGIRKHFGNPFFSLLLENTRYHALHCLWPYEISTYKLEEKPISNIFLTILHFQMQIIQNNSLYLFIFTPLYHNHQLDISIIIPSNNNSHLKHSFCKSTQIVNFSISSPSSHLHYTILHNTKCTFFYF